VDVVAYTYALQLAVVQTTDVVQQHQASSSSSSVSLFSFFPFTFFDRYVLFEL